MKANELREIKNGDKNVWEKGIKTIVYNSIEEHALCRDKSFLELPKYLLVTGLEGKLLIDGYRVTKHENTFIINW